MNTASMLQRQIWANKNLILLFTINILTCQGNIALLKDRITMYLDYNDQIQLDKQYTMLKNAKIGMKKMVEIQKFTKKQLAAHYERIRNETYTQD